jgi:hypothetical protein
VSVIAIMANGIQNTGWTKVLLSYNNLIYKSTGTRLSLLSVVYINYYIYSIYFFLEQCIPTLCWVPVHKSTSRYFLKFHTKSYGILFKPPEVWQVTRNTYHLHTKQNNNIMIITTCKPCFYLLLHMSLGPRKGGKCLGHVLCDPNRIFYFHNRT